jgi:predicted transcriptional regulator
MQKLKNEREIPITVKNESLKDFFARGKEIAKAIDQKKDILPIKTISFEDVHDLMQFLTDTKLDLVSTVRKKPFSISDLAKFLKRSRASISKDIQLLESVGILKSEYVTNPGHGKQRIISTFDKFPIKLTVETVI